MTQVDSKDYIQYNSIYATFWKRQNYNDTKQISGCQVWDLWLGLTT